MQLNQVTVPATNIDRSIDFYRSLGLKLIVRDSHYARFEMPNGDATFSLHLTHEPVRTVQGCGVYFECEDLDSRVAALKAKGITFDSDPVDQSWLWREAWLRDPAGVRICLYFAGTKRRYPPWRLND